MGLKVIVSETLPLQRALRALQKKCRDERVPIFKYVRLIDRVGRKDFYQKPSDKRRIVELISLNRRNRARYERQ